MPRIATTLGTFDLPDSRPPPTQQESLAAQSQNRLRDAQAARLQAEAAEQPRLTEIAAEKVQLQREKGMRETFGMILLQARSNPANARAMTALVNQMSPEDRALTGFGQGEIELFASEDNTLTIRNKATGDVFRDNGRTDDGPKFDLIGNVGPEGRTFEQDLALKREGRRTGPGGSGGRSSIPGVTTAAKIQIGNDDILRVQQPDGRTFLPAIDENGQPFKARELVGNTPVVTDARSGTKLIVDKREGTATPIVDQEGVTVEGPRGNVSPAALFAIATDPRVQRENPERARQAGASFAAVNGQNFISQLSRRMTGAEGPSEGIVDPAVQAMSPAEAEAALDLAKATDGIDRIVARALQTQDALGGSDLGGTPGVTDAAGRVLRDVRVQLPDGRTGTIAKGNLIPPGAEVLPE